MWEQSDSWNISEGTSWLVSQTSSAQEPSEPLWEQQRSRPFHSSPLYICLDFTSWLKKFPKFRSLDISSSSTFSSAHLCSTISSASHSLWDRQTHTHRYETQHLFCWNHWQKQFSPWRPCWGRGASPWQHRSSAPAWGVTGRQLWGESDTWSWSHFLSVARLLWTRHLWKDFTFYNRNDCLKVKYSTSFLDFYFSSKTQMINFPKLLSRSSRKQHV